MREINCSNFNNIELDYLKNKLYNLIVNGENLESNIIEEIYSKIKIKDSKFKLYWEDDQSLVSYVKSITSDKGYQNILLICGSVLCDTKGNYEFVINIDEKNLDMFTDLIYRWTKSKIDKV